MLDLDEIDTIADHITMPDDPPADLDGWKEYVGRLLPGQPRIVVDSVSFTLWKRANGERF